MDCPNCKEKMETSNLNKVEVNNCFYCEGSWISSNAITRILSSEPKAPNFTQFTLELNSTARVESKRTCPICLTPLLISSFRNIELDCCPVCNGVFFDQGEVKEIAPSAQKDLSHLVPAAYAANEIGWLVLISFFN